MANLSFTTAGATPLNLANAQRLGLGNSSITSDPNVAARQKAGLTPAATALNTAQSPRPVAPTPPPIPTPSTPVKSTTVNNADGSSHVTTYHAPETPGLLSASTNGTKSTGTTTETKTTPQSTFSGLVSDLGKTSKSGSVAAPGYIQDTSNYGAGNIDIGKKAADIAADYGKQIADVGQHGAKFQAGQLTTGTNPVAEGNAAITAQTTAAQQQALATGEEAALQGTGQELTGQNQAAGAANMAAGQAQQGQSIEQTGLQQAGSLAQPNATAQGQTVFDPTTGQFTGGSYQGNLSTVVNAIKDGQIGYTAGVDSLSGLSPTAKADVLAALGPDFDTVSSDANASTRGTNIQTGGTATTGANAQGLAQSIQQETELQTAASNAAALATQLSDALKSSGLNLTNSTDANTAVNNLQSRLGNSAYTQLNIAVNDARNAYQAILTATGATPTDAGTAANQNINANMSPKQILAAIDQLSAGVKARQDSAHQQTTQYQNQLSGSGASRTASSGGATVQTSAGPVNTNW